MSSILSAFGLDPKKDLQIYGTGKLFLVSYTNLPFHFIEGNKNERNGVQAVKHERV